MKQNITRHLLKIYYNNKYIKELIQRLCIANPLINAILSRLKDNAYVPKDNGSRNIKYVGDFAGIKAEIEERKRKFQVKDDN
ncbi:MAG: hypothetical protein GY707_16935 [Desulfobacteraceae bacterium]|nr:hypothetical protein [Desulfobacteraceae bacterium]